MNAPECPLLATFRAGEMNYEALFKPLAYVALIDSKGDPRAYQKTLKQHSGLQHLSFTIRHDNLAGDPLKTASKSQEDYSERLMYCISHMEHDIYLEEAGYPCSKTNPLRPEMCPTM